ncbi:hypothetical protein HPB50_010684 [Hyalomma asiaticum]|uniref:Uncharacterized protein n=1 Tax=Hyalomma asiaticum TaxID=266040 RepID=A0ACB7SDW9_HYAAI|nr:hypothetical protein HPB50_010684 [Hyalomma asiaticum]
MYETNAARLISPPITCPSVAEKETRECTNGQVAACHERRSISTAIAPTGSLPFHRSGVTRTDVQRETGEGEENEPAAQAGDVLNNASTTTRAVVVVAAAAPKGRRHRRGPPFPVLPEEAPERAARRSVLSPGSVRPHGRKGRGERGGGHRRTAPEEGADRGRLNELGRAAGWLRAMRGVVFPSGAERQDLSRGSAGRRPRGPQPPFREEGSSPCTAPTHTVRDAAPLGRATRDRCAGGTSA